MDLIPNNANDQNNNDDFSQSLIEKMAEYKAGVREYNKRNVLYPRHYELTKKVDDTDNEGFSRKKPIFFIFKRYWIAEHKWLGDIKKFYRIRDNEDGTFSTKNMIGSIKSYAWEDLLSFT